MRTEVGGWVYTVRGPRSITKFQMETTSDTPRAKNFLGPSRYIPELDGIRAVAVWMVVCLHLTDVSKLPAQVGAAIPPWLMFALDHGWLGVDLFFIPRAP